MLKYPQVLTLTDDARHAQELAQLLGGYAALVFANGLADLASVVQAGQFDIVLCDWPFYASSWGDVLKVIRHHDSSVPVVILSRTCGEREWVEVIEAGGFDILVAPYNKLSVLAVLEQAAASRDARARRQEPFEQRQIQ